jgi:hypothetical protein
MDIKSKTKKKSSAWIQKNSELSSYVIINCTLGGVPQTEEYIQTVAELQRELDELTVLKEAEL